MPSTINANDPRPKRAVALGHTTKNRLKSRLRQTEIHRKTAYLRERSPCSRTWKFSRFRLENKSKNSLFHSKNNLKIADQHKKVYKKACFSAKNRQKRHFYNKSRHTLSGMLVYSKGWTRD